MRSIYMHRLGFMFLLCSLLALVLSITAAAEPNVEITIWFARADWIPRDNFETFHKENPNIKVNVDVVVLEDVGTQFIINSRAGRAPDIAHVAHTQVPTLANAGLLRPSSDLIEQWKIDYPETYQALTSEAWNSVSYDGEIYGVGIYYTPYFLFYRKDWFEEAGLPTPPRTSEDMLEAARLFSTIPEGGNVLGFTILGDARMVPIWLTVLFRAFGGQWEDGVPIIDSEAGVHLIEFYQTLMREKLAHPDSLAWDSGEMRSAYFGGRAAMAIDGIHCAVPLDQNIPYEEGKWALALMPHRPGAEDEGQSTGFGYPFVISSQTEHPEAVLKVLEYLCRAEIQTEQAIRYGPVTNIEVWNDPVFQDALPWAGDVADKIPLLTTRPGHIKNEAAIARVLQDLRSEMMSNIYADPYELAAKYQALINQAANR